MNLVYRGVSYDGGVNRMDPALITYLMKQKQEQERREKETAHDFNHLLGGK